MSEEIKILKRDSMLIKKVGALKERLVSALWPPLQVMTRRFIDCELDFGKVFVKNIFA